MSEGRIIWRSHKGSVVIDQWYDEQHHNWNVSGECSECHQFPCVHVMQDKDGNWKFRQ